MKKHQKELIIVPGTENKNSLFITGSILYKNYNIGTFHLSKIQYPPLVSDFGAPYNTKYTYTLIFDKKNAEDLVQENIALDSIETNGFYQINGGIQIVNDLGIPLGTYKNIGETPEGIKYNMLMENNDEGAKIILNRIC